MEEKLTKMLGFLAIMVENQKNLAEIQEKLAKALEEVANNQSKLVLGQLSIMKSLGATKSPAEQLDKIFRDLAGLKS